MLFDTSIKFDCGYLIQYLIERYIQYYYKSYTYLKGSYEFV